MIRSAEVEQVVYSCGEIARLAETTLRTVRFYESEGLIKSEERRCGANRCFSPCQLSRLKLILRLRAADFSLAKIRDLLSLREKYEDSATDAKAFCDRVSEHLKSIDARVEALERLRQELVSMGKDAECRCDK